MAGVRCSMGSRLFADYVPDTDAEVVRRYRAAGLVLCGKSNTPEVGLAATTEGAFLGPARNPWNLDHTPGGSSGGAAAAVAAGLVPAAHASDGGGSIRIPASCCALVGLKPTRARVPLGPAAAEGWGSMATVHAVTRSVRDSAMLLDVTHGPARGDPYRAPAFSGSYLDCLELDPGPLRIALQLTPVTGADVHAECIAAARSVAATCESLGHHVEEASPFGVDPSLSVATGTLVVANVARTIDARLSVLGRTLRDDDIEAVTRSALESGRAITATAYIDALAAIHAAGQRLAAFLEGFDVVLSPTLVAPPVRIGWLDPTGDVDVYNARFGGFWGFTHPYNATGTPAISLPLHFSADGLPVGVQFAAAAGREDLLLQLAAQLEEACPWPALPRTVGHRADSGV